MFFPCSNLIKLNWKIRSTLESVFYFTFLLRVKPESALIQLIFSLTSVDMDEAYVQYISEMISGQYYKLGSQAPNKEIDWHKAAQPGRRKKPVSCQGSFPTPALGEHCFPQNHTKLLSEICYPSLFKAALHRQFDFSSGLHLIPMHHRRFWKDEFWWYKPDSSSHVSLHDPSLFAPAVL